MGFFFRKSANFGLFRLNFSKRGVGISTGVKGARVSFGPAGKYVTLGRNGFYYKKYFGKTNYYDSKTIKSNENPIVGGANDQFQNDQSNGKNMRYLYIFGIFPTIILLGFVTYKCFEPIKTIENFSSFAIIKNNAVNIRDHPAMDFSKILSLTNTGDKYPFFGKDEQNWCKILFKGDTAFVHDKFVDITNELSNKVVIRRYDQSPVTRVSIISLCLIPLIFLNLFLYRIDKRNINKRNMFFQKTRFQKLLVDASQLLQSGKVHDALRLYKEAQAIDPKSKDCYFGIAACNFDLENYSDSILNYKKGLEYEPENISALFNMALSYYYSKQEAYAITYFQKVLSVNNDHARAHFFLGMLEKDNDMSTVHYEKAIEGDLRSKEREVAIRMIQANCIYIGSQHLDNSRTEKAKMYLNKALAFGFIEANEKLYPVAINILQQHGLSDLSVKFLKLIGIQEPLSLKKEEPVPTKLNGSTFKFSKEYFNLLANFSKQIVSISDRLIVDETFKEKIKDNIIGSSYEKFIPSCIIYDLCQILKILSKDHISENSIETFGLALLVAKLTNGADFFTLGYDAVGNFFTSGKSKDLSESIIELSTKKNPLEISITTKSDDKPTSTETIKGHLALPPALKIIDHSLFDEYSAILYQFANILSKADNVVTVEEEELLKGIYQLTHNPLPEEKNSSLTISEVKKGESLDEVLSELHDLIGLDAVKQEVNSLINYIKIQKEREKVGLISSQVSYHCVFTGSPGTGKTTIARIVAKIYMHLGVLNKGHLVETDRSGLVAEYLGQTAVKVNKTVNSALDGVLFIDEAYSLVGQNQDDFGKEAVATLIKRMEDDRARLVVILAGYTFEMKAFIDTNPGFKSRFNRYIEFEDYTPKELESIYKLLCRKLDYRLTEEAEGKLVDTLNQAYDNRDKSFGNGRFVRNLFEKTLERQANRIASLPVLSKEILTTVIVDDIP